jgi:SAM-dependent methyltransferase
LSRLFNVDCIANLPRGIPIFEAQAWGSIHDNLKHRSDYICSEYFPHLKSGQFNEKGIRCENLQDLSFANETFQVVITQDVLEYVQDLIQAFIEIYRVLQNGGVHVFTVPCVGETKTREGQPDVYRDDPVGGAGLVYTDFGLDLVNLLNKAVYRETEVRPAMSLESSTRSIDPLREGRFETVIHFGDNVNLIHQVKDSWLYKNTAFLSIKRGSNANSSRRITVR